MKFPRLSGILLHPTALPSPFGIGDMGPASYEFIDFLARAGQSYWQILPLNPPSYADSPYDCSSSLAGNPLLISLEKIVEAGHLSKSDLNKNRIFQQNQVDYASVKNHKITLLDRAYKNFQEQASRSQKDSFDLFCDDHSAWLNDFALFMAIKETNDLRPWFEWELAFKFRRTKALSQARKSLADRIKYHQYCQWQFFDQWLKLKRYANKQGVKIIGDIPIFVSRDSADVWSNPHLFQLDKDLNPTVVSGVPPDYYCATGQLWGHPLYRWNTMAKDNYSWWIQRFKMAFLQADVVRIDHFRGFYDYWAVPAKEKTAVNGHWMKGPGPSMFDSVKKSLGDQTMIAEDSGDFSEKSRAGVNALLNRYGIPSMKILQYAFGDSSDNCYLPHNYNADCIVYTGTHDNDTVLGWYQAASTEKERDNVRRYLGQNGKDIAWDLIRLAWASTASTAMTTAQDLVKLGHDARMNTPGTCGTPNWCWRLLQHALDGQIADRLKELTVVYGRIPRDKKLGVRV